MIIKSFEAEKIKSLKNNLILLYGANEGHKNQIINELFKRFFKGEVLRFEENEILTNHERVISNLMNKSLFDDEKLIINQIINGIKIAELIFKNNHFFVTILMKSLNALSYK